MNTTKILRTALTIAAPLIAALGIALTVLIPSANASTLPWCRMPEMTLTLSHLTGQSGEDGLTLTARNDGPACTLAGYPQIGLVRSDGQAVAPDVTDGPTWFHGDPKPRTIVLGHDGKAVAWIGWADPGSGPEVYTSGLTVGLRRSPYPQPVAAIPFLARVWGGQMTVTRWVAAPKKAGK